MGARRAVEQGDPRETRAIAPPVAGVQPDRSVHQAGGERHPPVPPEHHGAAEQHRRLHAGGRHRRRHRAQDGLRQRRRRDLRRRRRERGDRRHRLLAHRHRVRAARQLQSTLPPAAGLQRAGRAPRPGCDCGRQERRRVGLRGGLDRPRCVRQTVRREERQCRELGHHRRRQPLRQVDQRRQGLRRRLLRAGALRGRAAPAARRQHLVAVRGGEEVRRQAPGRHATQRETQSHPLPHAQADRRAGAARIVRDGVRLHPDRAGDRR